MPLFAARHLSRTRPPPGRMFALDHAGCPERSWKHPTRVSESYRQTERERERERENKREREKETDRKPTKALQAKGQAGRAAWRCAAKVLRVASIRRSLPGKLGRRLTPHQRTQKLGSCCRARHCKKPVPRQKRHGSLLDPAIQTSRR